MTTRLRIVLPGDPAPKGYLEWHEWAAVQLKSGLRQTRCIRCSRFFFPQELSVDRVACLECAKEARQQ